MIRFKPETSFWRLITFLAFLLCAVNIIVMLHNRKMMQQKLDYFEKQQQKIMDSQKSSVPGKGNYRTNEEEPKPKLPDPSEQSITGPNISLLTEENSLANQREQHPTKLRGDVSLNTVTKSKTSVAPSPANKRELKLSSTNLSQIHIGNPLWLPIVNIENFFEPSNVLVVGRKRKSKGFLVMGVPTVYRSQAYYLTDTVRWLTIHLSKQERKKVIIVVFIADFDTRYRKKVVSEMNEKFPEAVESGLLQVIQAQKNFYPDLNNVPLLYGDDQKRVRWRSKQSLDYSFLYYYCADLAEYYIQLEDDILVDKGYFEKIESFLQIKKNDNWSIIEFGARGFIGMTYRTSSLLSLARFSRYYFWTMPIDWIFRIYNDIFLFGNGHNPLFRPPIFKHLGVYSSLSGQMRALEDIATISAIVKHPKNGNPPTTLTTTINECYPGHEMEKVYSGENFFWGISIKSGQFIELRFKKPIMNSRIIVSSGNKQSPNDSFLDTKLSVGYHDPKGEDECAKMRDMKSFSNMKEVDYTFPEIKNIYCVRLTILKVRSNDEGVPYWLVISKIRLL